MSKTEIWSEVQSVLEKYDVPNELVTELTNILEPKRGGGSVDIESLVKRDVEGNIVELKCSLSGVFLPATAENFYSDKQGVGGFRRASRPATAIKKEFDKEQATVKASIVDELIAGNIDNTDAQAQIAELEAKTPDYSTVG